MRVVDASVDAITLSVDWPTCSSRTPSGDGHSADPVQKQVPGERMTQKGLTNQGPLQKPA